MLLSISIRNVVLIESLDIDFSQGLNVFTGETGAGKSIFLDSLMLALGARSDSSLIRHGQEKLSVSASFKLEKTHPIFKLLDEQDIDIEDDCITLRRTVNLDGKSKAFINDNAISVGLLRQIGDILVEIHGQFANHTLLNQATHIDVLDKYAGHFDKKSKTKESYHKWQEIKKLKISENLTLEQARKEEEFLRFSVNEIESLDPKPGEIDELENKRLLLMNTQKLTENLNQASEILQNENIDGSLRSVLSFLEKSAQLVPNKFDEVISMLESAQIEISEASSSLDDICSGLELDNSSLPEIDDRLYAIKEIARKHRIEVEGISQLLNDFKNKLATLELGEDRIKELEVQEMEAKNAFIGYASSLDDSRIKAGQKLDQAVAKELVSLKLEKAKFVTEIKQLAEDDYNENGINKVAFMVATNSGQPLSPINKTASGGELARFMLALKVNLANTTPITSMVFDEVDTGIGGATATAVGQRLAILGSDKQILVVTHSPQVASFGDSHYKISKTETTNCILLNSEERIEEVARMLAGNKITDEAISAAKALIKDNHDHR